MTTFGVKIKLLMPKIVDRKKRLSSRQKKIVYHYVLSEILPNLKLAISWNHIKTDFIYKLKKSRVKFDDVNFLLSPVETTITSRRQTEFESMYTDFFFNYGVCLFATLSANEKISEN